jgi:hypothetical protein
MVPRICTGLVRHANKSARITLFLQVMRVCIVQLQLSNHLFPID